MISIVLCILRDGLRDRSITVPPLKVLPKIRDETVLFGIYRLPFTGSPVRSPHGAV